MNRAIAFVYLSGAALSKGVERQRIDDVSVRVIRFASEQNRNLRLSTGAVTEFQLQFIRTSELPMSKRLKAFEKLRATPTPADVKWSELKAVLEHLGYKMLKKGGSRRKFYHAEKNVLISCHKPHPSPDVDKGCIADIVEHLKINGFIEN